MPVTPTYPGVYIEEIPSGVRTIVGVATSITAFIGRTLRGPVNEPTIVNNFGEFERFFGGLDPGYTVAYAVQDFFGNGGAQAIIVRLYKPFFPDDATRATALADATTLAQTAAELVRDAADGATVEEVLTALDAKATFVSTQGKTQMLAAQAVAVAAHTEANKPPYMTDTQKMVIAGNPTDGHITLSFHGSSASDLDFKTFIDEADDNAAATALKTKLESILELSGNITSVTRSGTSPKFTFLIKFGGTLTGPQDLITVTSSLVPPEATVTVSLPLPDADSVKNAAAAAITGAVTAAAGAAAPINRARLTFDNNLVVEAATPGSWGNSLQVKVDYNTKPKDDGTTDDDLYNLTVTDTSTGRSERIRNISIASGAVRDIGNVLKDESSLIRVVGIPPTDRPSVGDYQVDPAGLAADSNPLLEGDFIGNEANKTGLHALEKAKLFNLLCIPPDTRTGNTPNAVYKEAMKLCVDHRAMLIVDSPYEWSANPDKAVETAVNNLSSLGLNGPYARNVALFFPRIRKSDMVRDGQVDTFVPCGAIAGIFARTDSARGVWKAPAGLDAAISGIVGLEVNFSDGDNGRLNPLAINTLRYFSNAGQVVWGARTLRGADSMGDEYKYIPVRRLALFIEETLYINTQWVVFEPNDEPLWAQIRLNIGAFMHDLFVQGAFQGKTPRDAYFVKCDRESTTQNDINKGIVNIVVGFAPLKPAEFVIIKLQQMAGQIQV